MKINLQPIISPSLPMTTLIYLGFFLVWITFYWFYDFPFEMQGPAGSLGESLLPSKSLVANLITFGLIILNSLILAQMNNRFAIVRTRTFMPTFIYLLLAVCWLPTYGNYVAALSSLFVLVAIYFSLGMYKDKKSDEQAFLSFFSLALGTFLVPEFLVLVVVFWIGFSLLNSMSGRVFFASVFGFITPWILLFSALYFFYGHTESLSQVQTFVLKYNVFNYKNIPAFVYAAVMLAILIVSLWQITTNDRQDSIQTRNILNFFKIFIFGLLFLFVFRYAGFTSYLPLIAILYALLTAYIFTLLRNFFNSVVFPVLCVVNLMFAFYMIIIAV